MDSERQVNFSKRKHRGEQKREEKGRREMEERNPNQYAAYFNETKSSLTETWNNSQGQTNSTSISLPRHPSEMKFSCYGGVAFLSMGVKPSSQLPCLLVNVWAGQNRSPPSLRCGGGPTNLRVWAPASLGPDPYSLYFFKRSAPLCGNYAAARVNYLFWLFIHFDFSQSDDAWLTKVNAGSTWGWSFLPYSDRRRRIKSLMSEYCLVHFQKTVMMIKSRAESGILQTFLVTVKEKRNTSSLFNNVVRDCNFISDRSTC